MQALTLTALPEMRRQTHMYCTICHDVAESYDQKDCSRCGSTHKWSVPWKNVVVDNKTYKKQ